MFVSWKYWAYFPVLFLLYSSVVFFCGLHEASCECAQGGVLCTGWIWESSVFWPIWSSELISDDQSRRNSLALPSFASSKRIGDPPSRRVLLSFSGVFAEVFNTTVSKGGIRRETVARSVACVRTVAVEVARRTFASEGSVAIEVVCNSLFMGGNARGGIIFVTSWSKKENLKRKSLIDVGTFLGS